MTAAKPSSRKDPFVTGSSTFLKTQEVVFLSCTQVQGKKGAHQYHFPYDWGWWKPYKPWTYMCSYVSVGNPPGPPQQRISTHPSTDSHPSLSPPATMPQWDAPARPGPSAPRGPWSVDGWPLPRRWCKRWRCLSQAWATKGRGLHPTPMIATRWDLGSIVINGRTWGPPKKMASQSG